MQDTLLGAATADLGSVDVRQVETVAHRGAKSHGDGVLCIGLPQTFAEDICQISKHLAEKCTAEGDTRQAIEAVDMCSVDAGLAKTVATRGGKKRRSFQSPHLEITTLTSPDDCAHSQGKQKKKIKKTAHLKDAASGMNHAGMKCTSQLDGIAVAVDDKVGDKVANALTADQIKGHDKYCHFCQHVKINMLACTKFDCTHRCPPSPPRLATSSPPPTHATSVLIYCLPPLPISTRCFLALPLLTRYVPAQLLHLLSRRTPWRQHRRCHKQGVDGQFTLIFSFSFPNL